MIALPPDLRTSLAASGRDLKIVIIRLGAMGDVLRTLPPVRLLRSALPLASIVWIVERPWDCLLDGHVDIDEVRIAPRREWQRLSRSPREWPRLLAALRAFRGELAAIRADLAIDFHGNLRSGWVAAWSKAPVRLGYAGHQQKEGNRWFTTHRVGAADRRTPRMERNLALIRALGLPDGPLPGGALPLVAAGRAAADAVAAALPARVGGLAVLSPGSSVRQAYKRPPVELLATACRRLVELDLTPLVVWGPGEQADAAAVIQRSAGTAVLAPPTGLAALAALLDRARIFIGGDTGPLHMACAVGCPVVGIYGPTDPRVNRPWGVTHRVVAPADRRYTGIKRIDRAAGGFAGITAAQIESAVDELLAGERGRNRPLVPSQPV
ncbi:MAG TPA: glycosyltransferase family 9 protein [Candidatus Polarisedimenticolaceae bacterium]|nr:glycosyltransferase family 9 protein [Candidatus Polarisedimenticolaceae bacterium]